MADTPRESGVSRGRVTSDAAKDALLRRLGSTAHTRPCGKCGKPNSVTEAAHAFGYWCEACCTAELRQRYVPTDMN
jgi:hypothetical protein